MLLAHDPLDWRGVWALRWERESLRIQKRAVASWGAAARNRAGVGPERSVAQARPSCPGNGNGQLRARPPAAPMEAPSLSPPAACLVFAGSSEQDVALAKSFWNSVTLQPQLESCLCSNGSGGALGQRRSHLDSREQQGAP